MRGLTLVLPLALLMAGSIQAGDPPTELPSDRVPGTRTGGNCLIRGATILTASHGRLEGSDIRIENGKITAIGESLAAPDGAVVIDASGKFVIPGIFDAHSHMAVSGGVNEGTLSITAECRIGDCIRNDDATIYRALAGGVTAAHTMHGSANAIGGQCQVIKLKYLRPVSEMLVEDGYRTIKFALGENPKRSRSRGRSTRFPSTRMGVEAVIRRGFIEARDYIERWERYAEERSRGHECVQPRRDLRLEALAAILRGEIKVNSHCYRADEILMLMRVAEEFGFRISNFHHVLEGYKVAPEIAAHGAGASTFSDWWAYKIEAYDAIPYNADILTRAGIPVTFNSDSGELVRRLYHEAAKGVRYGGLSEEQALRLVTLNAAIQYGLEHRMGSIDVGKDADLALFNGHPFSVYSLCEMTLIEGEVFFERTPRDIEVTALDVEPVQREKRVKASPRSEVAADGPSIAIRNATLHPVSAPVIEGGTLVIRGNRIAALGRDVAVPPGAEVIDGEGLHVYPGMIDSGTTIGLTEIGSISATQDIRENGPYNPDLRSWVAINHDSEIIPVTRLGGITSVMTGPSGGVISGQCALVHLDGWTHEKMLVESPLALAVNFPRVPRTERWQENSAVKELGKWFERARRYQERIDRAAELGVAAPTRDAKLEALVPFARGEHPVVLSASRDKQIVDAIEFALEQGLDPILRGCGEAWKVADFIAKRDVPCIVGPVLTTPRGRYDPYDSAFFNAAVLQRAGVRFCFQTGSASNSRNLHHHAGMSAAFGLDRDAALRAVTLSAAEIWGVDDRLGSLDVGKVADVIITDGDPLEFLTELRYLFIDGRRVSLESKHTRLWERYLERVTSPVGRREVRSF